MDVSHIEYLVPEGLEALDLTLGELDKATFHLKCDPLDGINDGDRHKRYATLAYLCWLWAKREDPKAKLETFREWTIDEAQHALRMDEKPQSEGGEEPDPTGPSDEPSESS